MWFWRNKKLWEGKVVTPAYAMDSSFKMYSEWLEAKKKHVFSPPQRRLEVQMTESKWRIPEPGAYKVNVDASVFPNAPTFSVGMIMRDHLGSFVACKVACFPMVETVFEAEMVGIREAPSWIKEGQFSSTQVLVESDSLLSVKAILEDKMNLLEVGEVVEECKQELQSLSSVSVRFIRKDANRVAHVIARISCLANSNIVFTSPPTCLLEALSFDCLS